MSINYELPAPEQMLTPLVFQHVWDKNKKKLLLFSKNKPEIAKKEININMYTSVFKSHTFFTPQQIGSKSSK